MQLAQSRETHLSSALVSGVLVSGVLHQETLAIGFFFAINLDLVFSRATLISRPFLLTAPLPACCTLLIAPMHSGRR